MRRNRGYRVVPESVSEGANAGDGCEVNSSIRTHCLSMPKIVIFFPVTNIEYCISMTSRSLLAQLSEARSAPGRMDEQAMHDCEHGGQGSMRQASSCGSRFHLRTRNRN